MHMSSAFHGQIERYFYFETLTIIDIFFVFGNRMIKIYVNEES